MNNPFDGAILCPEWDGDDTQGELDCDIDALIDEIDEISAASKGLSVRDYLARRGLEDALVEWASGQEGI